MKYLLWCVLAVCAALLLVFCASGPFHIGSLSIGNPLNIESFIALAALALLLRSRPQTPAQPAVAREWWPIAILVAAGFAAWGWTLQFPFVADDYAHISNSLHATPSYLGRLFTVPAADRFFRPFVLLAYAAQARCWGASRVAWHTASVLLHIGNSALVYRLARRRRIPPWPALGGGLFFLLHGARPEAVTWISAQFDLWAVCFFLLALMALDRLMQSGKWIWEAASLGALLLALLSKESAYVFPAVAVVFLWAGGIRGARFARLGAPPAVLTAAVFLYRWVLLGGIGGYRTAETGQPYILSLGVFRTAKAMLMRLPAILTFPINWTHGIEWWLGATLVAALAGWAILSKARPPRREMWMMFAVILLCAAPVHQFLAIGTNLEKSRVLYLPSVFFAVLLAAAFASLDRRAAIVAGVMLLAFQIAALEHNLVIWQGVSQLAERTCAEGARAVRESPGPVAVSSMPNDVDGVYFLHTGLRPCIEWAAGAPLPNLIVEDESPPAAASRVLIWQGAPRGTWTLR